MASGQLVHVFGAGGWAVELVTVVTTVVDAITEVGIVDTLTIGAVLGPPGTGGDLAHEGEEGLAGGQLPLLASVLLQHRLDTLASGDVWLVQGPVAIVLADLAPSVCCQGVGGQVVLGLVAQPVRGLLLRSGPGNNYIVPVNLYVFSFFITMKL